eukprot:6309456-Pyramimonas_sp.AAC.1
MQPAAHERVTAWCSGVFSGALHLYHARVTTPNTRYVPLSAYLACTHYPQRRGAIQRGAPIIS